MQKLLKSRRARLAFVGIVFVAVSVSVVLIARPIENKTDKIQPDWSRGTAIGFAPWKQPPAIVASDDGQRIHLAWPARKDGASGVQYLQLDGNVRQVSAQWLGGLEGTPETLGLILDGQGAPHVLGKGRLPGASALQLLHWSLEPAGPELVSLPGVAVEDYVVLPAAGGTLQVLWVADSDSPAHGLYHVALTPGAGSRRLNARPTEAISAQVDRLGVVHLIWEERLEAELWEVFYACFEGDSLQPVEGISLTQLRAYARLGLDDERVYVVWGQEVRRGHYAGMGFTDYVVFPIGQPASTTQRELSLPDEGLPEYLPYSGEFNVTTMASAEQRRYGVSSKYLHMPALLPGQHDEMALALVASLAFGYNSRVVPALVLMRDGEAVGYHVMAYPLGSSVYPVVAADKAGNLYALWMSGSSAGGYRVYYAATTATARARLDGMDITDMLVGIASAVWRVVGGLALLPFLPLLLMPSFAILIAYSVWCGSEGLSGRRSYAMMIVACLVYWLIKEFVLGGVLAEPIVGRELVGWSRTVVVWAVQLAIAAVAAWITWRQIAAGRTDSIFWTSLIFIVCDILLTMLVAGPTLALRG
ncbi:MAG: hypothetical protein JW850_18415 [Thermoflexales bacterium]|nr:hypothetical protein [Thermoflexales bacterium]